MGTSQVVLVVKNPPANTGDMRCRFDPWVGKIPWRRARQPTLVFLPGASHGQSSLSGYRIHRISESDTTEATACTHTNNYDNLIVLIVCQGIFRYWCPIHHVCFLNTDLITLTDFVEYNDNQFYKRPKKKSLPLHHFVKLVQLVPTNCKCLSLIFYF